MFHLTKCFQSYSFRKQNKIIILIELLCIRSIFQEEIFLKEPILRVQNLRTYFSMAEGTVKAVDDVSFDVHDDEVIGIVGETGSGKSVTVKSISGLIGKPGFIADGNILFKTEELKELQENGYLDLTKLKGDQFTKIRGNHISIIFQDPMTSLNPIFTIRRQLLETIMFHQKVDEKQAEEIAVQMLEKVGLPNPRERLDNYPFELSGGQRQRVIIAIGISCNPEILIADEPTTALDVTVQAQILELMKDLQREYHSGLIFITHDLAVIAEMADKVMVMYGGKTMEYSDVYTIFEKPLHPYSKLLLDCIPRLDMKQDELKPIPGQPPTMLNAPNLCPFLPRCPRKLDHCLKEVPPLEQVAENHFVRCFNPFTTKVQVAKGNIGGGKK